VHEIVHSTIFKLGNNVDPGRTTYVKVAELKDERLGHRSLLCDLLATQEWRVVKSSHLVTNFTQLV